MLHLVEQIKPGLIVTHGFFRRISAQRSFGCKLRVPNAAFAIAAARKVKSQPTQLLRVSILRMRFERSTDEAVQALPPAGGDLLIKRLADQVVTESKAALVMANQTVL
jgi:hypothetical protein